MSAPDAPPPPLPPAGQPSFWPEPAAVQWIKDNEHLRLLGIFHYVVGGLAILFSSMFIFHIVFGAIILNNPGFFDTPSTPVHFPSSSAPAASPDGTDPAPPTPTHTPAVHPLPPRMKHVDNPPAFLGYIMMGIGSFAVLLGWTIGGLLIYSGRCLARRTRRMFSLVVAGISCVQAPFGTILGVFTLVTLQRPSIKALYAAAEGEVPARV